MDESYSNKFDKPRIPSVLEGLNELDPGNIEQIPLHKSHLDMGIGEIPIARVPGLGDVPKKDWVKTGLGDVEWDKKEDDITWEAKDDSSDITWEDSVSWDKEETKHDWGTTDARDQGKTNKAMGAPERKGTALERARLVAEEAFAQTPITGRDDGATQLQQAKNIRTQIAQNKYLGTPDRVKKAEALEKEGINRLAKYIMLRETLRSDISEANPSLVEQIVGGAAGGVTDPLNLIGPAKGATVLATMAKNFAVAAPFGMLRGLEQGEQDMIYGLAKTNPTIADLLKQGVETGAIAAALAGVFHMAGGRMQKVEYDASPEAKELARRIKEGTPTEVPKIQYPEISPEFKPDVSDIERSQTVFADSLQPPDQVRPAKVTGVLAPEEMPVAGEYPKIEGEVPNAGAPVESASYIPRQKEQRVPYQEPQGAVPNEPFVDVGPQETGSPYMGRQLAEIATAEGEPATHGMDFVDNGYQDALNYEKFLIERFPDDVTPQDKLGPSQVLTELEKFDGLVAHKPQVGSAIYRAKNIGEVVKLLDSHVPRHLRELWDKMVVNLDENIPFLIRDRGDPLTLSAEKEFQRPSVHALAGYLEDGSQYVAIQGLSNKITGSGMSVGTIAHEIYHTLTKNAIRIGEDSTLSKRPEYAAHRQFASEARKIYEEVLKKMDKSMQLIYQSELSSLDEFITWGSTDLTFKNVLDNIKLGPETLWQRFVRAVGKLFGVTDRAGQTALEAVMDLSKRFDEINVSNAGMREFWNNKVNGKLTKQEKFNQSNLPEQVAKDIYRIKDGYDLLNYLKTETIGDLGYAIIKDTPVLKQVNDFIVKYFTTTNQMARIYRHPVLIWTFNKLGRIRDQADTRITALKDQLDSVVDLKRKDQLKMFKVLEDMQDPTIRPEIAKAEEAGTMGQFLESRGLPKELVQPALDVLSVMQQVYSADRRMAQSMGRDLPRIPGYFPRSHGGPFKFKVTKSRFDEAKGQTVDEIFYIRGFKDPITAQKYQNDMKLAMKDNADGFIVSPVERVDVPGMIDSIGDMLTSDALPDYLKQQVQSIEEKIEFSRRKFELERASKNIGGFIGEILEDDTWFTSGYAENSRLLDLLNQRLDDSWRFEQQATIINDIVKPLMWNQEQANRAPRLHDILNKVVLRELGHDTGPMKHIDKAIQKGADAIATDLNKIWGKIGGYDPSNISLLSPTAVKQMAQFWTWFTSAMKLGWNIPLWAVNATAPVFVVADGIRTAAKEGVNPVIATHAFMRMSVSPFIDPDAVKFMNQAIKDGRVTARQADVLDVTATHGAAGVRKTADKIVNAPRNMIEEFTNYVSLLYYYNYYKLADPKLTGEQLTSKVYQATRSWTGDYTDTATPLHISQMGTAGKLSGNFAKWMYNQTGRLLDDLSDIRDNPIKAQAYMPLLANMSMIVLAAGAMGLPVIAEYEYLRMLGNKTGWWDWKPFAAYYDEAKTKLAKEKMDFLPDWGKRGAFSYVNEGLTRWLTDNKESGIDMSGSMRHAPILQANTVAFEQFIDMMKGGSSAVKVLFDSVTNKGIATEQDYKTSLKLLPTSVQSMVDATINRKQRDGLFIAQSKFNEEGDYAETPLENKLAMAGFRTSRRNAYNDKRQYAQWIERTAKEKSTELMDRALSNTDNPAAVQEMLREMAALSGMEAVNTFQKQLEGRAFAKITTYDERKAKQLIDATDSETKVKLVKIIKQMRQMRESHNIYSNQLDD